MSDSMPAAEPPLPAIAEAGDSPSEADQPSRACWFCGAPNPMAVTVCGFCGHHADDGPTR